MRMGGGMVGAHPPRYEKARQIRALIDRHGGVGIRHRVSSAPKWAISADLNEPDEPGLPLVQCGGPRLLSNNDDEGRQDGVGLRAVGNRVWNCVHPHKEMLSKSMSYTLTAAEGASATPKNADVRAGEAAISRKLRARGMGYTDVHA